MQKVTFTNMKSALSSAVKTSALILSMLIAMQGNSLKAQETLSDNDAKNLAPIEGKAIVYIVRPSSMGSLVRIGVECDKEGLGSTKAKQYIYAILDPGARTFTAYTENHTSLDLTLEAGKIYFIQQKIKMGLVVARVGLELMNESDGRKALNDCKLSSDVLHGNVELIKNNYSIDISNKFTETANKISVDRTDEQTSHTDNTVTLKQKASLFLNNLNGAVPVKKEDNLIGLSISSVSKSGNDYIVSWTSSNDLIKNSSSNQAYLLSQIHFIDPENYENNYQPFTIENGKISRTFEAGDEISNQVERVKFEPPSKVMYVYFKGVEKSPGNPSELYTVPLFFTIVLGDTPYILEQTPRYAGTMFDKALSAKTMNEQTASNNATARSETPSVQQTPPVAQPQPSVQNTQPTVQTTQNTVQQTQSTAQRSQPAMNNGQQATTQKQIEKFRRWYVDAGLSIGVLVPDDVFSTMAPVGGGVGVGFYITPHNRVSFDVNFVSNSPNNGSFSYTKSYTDGSSESFTDGKIYRDYSSSFVMLSYDYIFTPSKKYTIRLGASLGSFDLSSSNRYVPQVDNTPIDYPDEETAAVCGIGVGFTWNLGSRWFLDAGYRFLANSGMYIDGFNISAPIHQINLTLGFRF